MANTRIFQSVPQMRVGRSLQDLSYEKKFTCDFGELIPVMCDEVVPGDVISLRNEVVIRMQPLVSPVIHEIYATTHYFFVPNRLIWDDWENFITGGKDGDFTTAIPTVVSGANDIVTGSLWDYFGLPLVSGIKLSAFPFRCYNLIWNNYYRDETLQDEIDISLDSRNLLFRCWEKDYFSSSLPWQQRGTAPALPISSVLSGSLSGTGTGTMQVRTDTQPDVWDTFESFTHASQNGVSSEFMANSFGVFARGSDIQKQTHVIDGVLPVRIKTNSTATDFSNVNVTSTTFDVSDLRLAFQVQKWLERNARSGCRYTEELKAHFGVSPRDERLQRPEYIGGSKSPVIVSEVLQTSSTDATSPQGNLAGHGISADTTNIKKYRATEFGYVVGIMSIMPRLSYVSQGVNRQWLRTNKYDFYFPEFQNLSEQAIYEAELYATPDNTNHIFDGSTVSADYFGFQGRYDELRSKQDMVCGELRNELSYWHLARKFDNAPALNASFVSLENSLSSLKRIFAVQSRDGFVVNYANIVKALRPITSQSVPGLIDHN